MVAAGLHCNDSFLAVQGNQQVSRHYNIDKVFAMCPVYLVVVDCDYIIFESITPTLVHILSHGNSVFLQPGQDRFSIGGQGELYKHAGNLNRVIAGGVSLPGFLGGYCIFVERVQLGILRRGGRLGSGNANFRESTGEP